MSTGDRDPKRSLRRLNLLGLATVAILVFGIGGWAATAQLSGAVIASGTVVVESHAKKVQHPSGGIVGTIAVREGDRVEAGDILMRLDDTLARATVGVIRSQLDQFRAREARLRAERDDTEMSAGPEAGVDGVAGPAAAPAAVRAADLAFADEKRLFASRQSARQGQREQLRERINQSRQEVVGLAAQQEAKTREIAFIAEELKGVAELFRKNLVPIVRFMQLQRDEARLEGERGSLIAEIARAHARVIEIELQIIQLDRDFRTEVLRELREVQGRIAELEERIAAADDQLRRIDIRAPQAGIVHQLAVHTVGGVIAGQETLMLIIPRADDLVIEARIAPGDVDQVWIGVPASVRILAGNRRVTPVIEGSITRIAADLSRDPVTHEAFYAARVGIAADQLALLGDFRMLPGMPAEIFVETQERTPLEFVLRPLSDQLARTFRER